MKKLNYFKYLLIFLIAFNSQRAFAVSSGVYSVGAGGDFPHFSAILADLSTSTVTGPITYNILPGTYSGSDWQASINSILGTSGSNRVTFQAQNGAGTVTINIGGSSSANYIFRLNNASYITIRNLTLNNTSSTDGRVIDIAGASSNDSITGCVLSGVAGTASSDARAIVLMGTSLAPLTGRNNVIANNTIQNGFAGVQVYGSGSAAGATADDHVIQGNTITAPYAYGILSYYAGTLKVINNIISGTATTLGYGMSFYYNQEGGDVSGNTIDINTTSGTHYGIYHSYTNSTTVLPFTMNNNNVSVKGTSGTCYSLYNNYSNDISLSGNTFNAEVSSGTVYAPFMAYGGRDITATTNVFGAKSTTGGICPNSSYYLIYNNTTSTPNNITIRGNVFNYNTSSGTIGYSSTAYYMYYPINCVISKNQYNITRTSSGTMYGFAGYYFMYYGTNTRFDSNKITINYSSGGTIYNLAYQYAMYYGSNNSFSNDTINITSTSATVYGLGTYFGYRVTGLKTNNNLVNVTNTSSSTIYTPYYFSAYLTSSEANDNTFNITGTSGTIQSPYYMNYACVSNASTNNNKFNINATSATIYSPNYLMYSSGSSVANGNEFNITTTSSGSTYCPYYLNSAGSSDTVENNVWNVNRLGGSLMVYNYNMSNLSRNNTWNLDNGSGTIQFMAYYGAGGTFSNNTINAKTTSGTIYGLYANGGSSSYSWNIINNKFNLESSTGTIYGYYGNSYAGKNSFVGNVMNTNTSGSSYLYYTTYGYYSDQLFFNNTFHSNATGSTNQLFRQSGGSNSFKGKMYLHNNIFSSSNPTTGNAVDIADTSYFRSDYNLLYAPGAVTLRSGNPSVTTTSMLSWKQTTKQDMNSLFYDPGYMNAANGDLRPNPANPNSWSVQGRGIHLPGDTIDILGNARAKTRFDGVPDLGAYEFTPASTPPDAIPDPALPIANTTQAFTFGGDTVGYIDWGNTVPSSVNVKQYTGLQPSPMPTASTCAPVGRMFFYTAVNTLSPGVYAYKPRMKYKDPWLGDISTEANARIARSSNGGSWVGYNFENGLTDVSGNVLQPKDQFDSLSSKFSGVENARIGTRCVIAPSGLKHSNVKAFSADMEWNEEFCPIGYELVVDNKVTDPVPPFNPQFSSSAAYPVSGLNEDTKYFIHIRTICGAGDTSGWAIDSFTTMVTCHAPVIRDTNLTDTRAVIYWDEVPTVVSYEYVIDKSPTPPAYGTYILSKSVLANALDPGTTYYAHVRSKCNTIYNISPWGTHEFTTKWNTGVKDAEGGAGLSVYPNPTKGLLTVHVPKIMGEGTITITDITGKVILQEKMDGVRLELNIQSMPSGVYMVKYTDQANTTTLKLNKE